MGGHHAGAPPGTPRGPPGDGSDPSTQRGSSGIRAGVLCSVPAMTMMPAARNAATYASTTSGWFRFGISSAAWIPRSQQAPGERLGGLLPWADRRRAVGQGGVAGDAVQLEDQPVGVVERDCGLRARTPAGPPS